MARGARSVRWGRIGQASGIRLRGAGGGGLWETKILDSKPYAWVVWTLALDPSFMNPNPLELRRGFGFRVVEF